MQFLRPTIIRSSCHAIHFNLGFESFLFSQSIITHPVMFLWSNDKTIVIGRHQNPWKECNLQNMRMDNVQLQRRNSGGGAVYQDLGNHCFTFLNPFQSEDPKTINNHILINTLSKFNIQAQPSGRNDIIVDGRKISGSAYQLSLGTKLNPNKVALHHGTMLIDVQFDDLSKYLTPTKKKLQSKGVDSVRSRVINLKQINPEVNVQSYEDELIEQFRANNNNQVDMIDVDLEELKGIEYVRQSAEKLTSWEWLYGYTPQFTVNVEERFDWGSVDVYFNVENNVIKECKIYSDCLYPDYITEINQVFVGERYDFEGVEKAFNKVKNEPQGNMNEQFKVWLLSVI